MSRTLIVHTGAIGDLIVALPTIAALSADSEIELAGHQDRLAIAVEAGVAAAAHSLDAIRFHTVFDAPSATLKGFMERFERAVVFMRDVDGSLRNGLRACGIRHAETHAGLPDADWTRHATEYYAQCLGVSLPGEFRLNIRPVGEPLDVVIHPGSGSARKNWPIANFRALAAELKACGRDVTWCVGPAELESGLDAKLEGDVLSCESLVELAGRLATARQFIGNDGGITHLAAALGVPTMAIFGSTAIPNVWAPRGEHVRVVTGVPWPDLKAVLLLSN